MMYDKPMHIAWVLPLNLISAVCAHEGVDPLLVGAIIYQESKGNACATRYEPKYQHTTNVARTAFELKISYSTEEVHQKTSWGLMQVMGGVARECGFTGHLVELCDPKINITYGCRKLAQIKKRYQKIEDVISAYNMGTPRKTPGGFYINESYVDAVMKNYSMLQSLLDPKNTSP